MAPYQVFPPQVLPPQDQGLHHQHAGDAHQRDDHQERLERLLLVRREPTHRQAAVSGSLCPRINHLVKRLVASS